MYGKKVKLRALFLLVLVTSIVLTIFLILNSLKENVIYFLSPTETKYILTGWFTLIDPKKVREKDDKS